MRRQAMGLLLLAVIPVVMVGCSAKGEIARRDAEIARLQSGADRTAEEMQQLERDHEAAVQKAKQLQSELSELTERERVTMERLEQMTVIRLSETMLFPSGSADLTPEGRRVVAEIGDILARYPNHEIRVEGHADTQPIRAEARDRFASNWELSAERATTVVRQLIKEHHISPDRIVALGRGEFSPVASNDTYEGRAKNRRVEIYVAMPAPVRELMP